MQVTFIVPAPWGTISGGYLYDHAIVDGLRAAGHAVNVVALAGKHPLPDDAARQAARAAWAALPADSVAVIDGLALPAFAEFSAAFAKRAVVGLIHHPTALETGRSEAASATLRALETTLFAALTRAIVTSTDTEKRLIGQFGVPAGRIAVVEPGTAPASRSPGPAHAGCAILAIGTLLPRKGHDVLLRALSRLGDLEWRLTIVGAAPDADYAGTLHALPAQLGIESRVVFAGQVAPADLEPLWQDAGMFALATHYEGYGMAIAEALRRGLPVAVTAGGAAAALVTPECAVICAPGDQEQLSKALRRVIYDRTLRLAMADAAWAIGESLPDWPTQAQLFASFLEAAPPTTA